MKQFKYTALLFLLTSFLLVSCEKEEKFSFETGALPTVTDQSGYIDYFDLDATELAFTIDAVATSGVSQVIIEKTLKGETVPFATVNGSELSKTFTMDIDEAMSGFSISTDDLALGDELTFTYDIATNDGRVLKNNSSHSYPVACPSNLAGLYSVYTEYSQHDFLPDYATATLDTIAITDEGDGNYSVADLSGGLYSEGPYVAEYGTSGIAATFREVCNAISWTGQEDPWGAVIPTEGGVNAVDPETGVITISWFCEAYSESGVSVYTPL